ncbi:MAG: hypothetical protein JNM66_09090 [Bryobacterales bacterium]|nr:hypothetical protein [Bryobacterales bacterium]
MRGIFLVAFGISSMLRAASTEAPMERISTGFLRQAGAGEYWAMAAGYRASFDKRGIQLVRHGRRAAIRFPGANLRWQAEGEAVGQVHFLGEENRTYIGASGLRARGALPGLDIVIRLREGRLKSEFQLAAGVAAAAAGYCLDGATARTKDDGQALRVDAGDGWQWEERGLESWQTAPDGRRIPVETRFRVDGGCVHFETGKIDSTLPLTIDPELAFSTYVGGGLFDGVTAVATDAQGNVYVGGWTESSDFASLSGYQGTSGGRIDGFVAKIDANGQLLFSTYLGGAGEDRVQAIVVDGAGVITVAGHTNSINFPTLGAARGALSGGRDAFITRLYAAGNQLVFSTYWGGLGHDAALAVTLDLSGNVVVAGETASTDFPTQAAYSASASGGVDGFLARFSPAGVLQSSTYFGGGADDRIRGVAVSSNGALHVTGSTASANFPVSAALYPSLRGSMDAFYARFNSTGTFLTSSTYLGGGAGSSLNEEAGYGIAIDTLGRVWIAGVTPSTDFPGVTGGRQTAFGGGASDAFVTVLTAAGVLEWSTYIGGGGIDVATSIAAGAGFVGLSGYTTSNDLPVAGALQTARGGEYDAFWAAFPIVSNTPLYVSYLGGSGSDSALATAASGSAMAVGGSTLSANFPLNSATQASNPGSYGGFASRLRFGPGPITVSPSSGGGLSNTFTFNISHANGSAAVVSAAVIFNTSNSFNNGCYIYYDRASNVVSLYRDAGAVWLPLTPGAASSVDNGVCTLQGSSLTVTSSASSLILTLPVAFSAAFSGAKNIYANATDAASLGAGWPQTGTWNVVAPAAPVVGTVTPASGSGLSQTFAFTFSDANGAQDIAVAAGFINNVFSTANGCYFTYDRVANTLSLFRDSDSAFLAVTPGTNASVQNTNCAISGAGASVTTSGTLLTLTVPITFQPSFTGARAVYAAASDTLSLTTGWQTVGTWTPYVSHAPVVGAVTPASGTGTAQSFSFTFTDGNGYADITTAAVLFNTSASTSNGCYLSYNASTNTLTLLRDSDGTFLNVTPGASITIENAVCEVNGASVVVAKSGNQLQLVLTVTFKSGVTGSRTIYGAVADAGQSTGWQPIGNWSPVAVNAPAITSVSPVSGSATSQVFTLAMSDANGALDIASANLLINTSVSTANGCSITFTRATNTFTLFRDSDSAQLALFPGSIASIENASCVLGGNGLGVSLNGNQLILTIPITFKAAFSGAKTLYASVTDSGGLTSGWQPSGSWNAGAAAAPALTAITPNAGTALSQNFTVTLADANGALDIAGASVLFSANLNGNNACFLFFSRPANLVYLFRDSDGSWQPVAPGSSASATNANCTLSGAALTITPAANTITLVLPITFQTSFTGAKTIYASVTDQSNLTTGWITAGTWTLGAPPAPPTFTSLTPNSGIGASQTFSLQVSDPDGFGDITAGIFLINAAINGNNGCYISFSRAANSFYLFRDSDASWLPLTPGSAGSVSNTNCTLAGTGLGFSGSGATLTVTLPLTFKSPFSGTHNFYVNVNDATGRTTGWVTAGTWTTPGAPAAPAITSITPNSGSGATQTFSLVVSDPNGHVDIVSTLIVINGSLSGTNACYLAFNRAAGLFYLFRDSDGTWLPITPGAATSVSNSNCALAGASLAISGSGTALTISLPLSFTPAFSGSKNIYATATDTSGLSSGWATAGNWSPSGSPSAPSVASLAPSSGSGAAQTFTAVISDANGFADIASALVVINSTLSGSNACYLAFSRAANLFYLFRDSDGIWLSLTPGTASTVSNPNCSLSGTGLGASGAGNTLTLTLPLSFTAAFSGSKTVYITTSDSSGLSSGWITAGTWNPNGAPAAPTVSSLTPSSGSGVSQTFTAVLSDANGHSDIASALIILNSSVSGSNACYLAFNRATNLFHLFRDSDGAWLPLSPGTAGSVANANCTLSGAALTATGAGNSLTLLMPLSFSPSFVGPRNFYINAGDRTGLSSGWVTAGVWTRP